MDIPKVDWIIQYDAPHEPEGYLHRVGRTARGANSLGKALMLLLPSEVGMIRVLKQYNIDLNEYDFPEEKLAQVQDQLEMLIEKNFYLQEAAKDAYKAYLHVSYFVIIPILIYMYISVFHNNIGLCLS